MKSCVLYAAGLCVFGVGSSAHASFSVSAVGVPGSGYQILPSSLRIEDSGQVVGDAEIPGTTDATAFVESTTSSSLYSKLPSAGYPYVNGVSANGILVGQAQAADGTESAFVQSGATLTWLVGPNGSDVGATAVNGNGQVVGMSSNGSDSEALLWSGGKPAILQVQIGNQPQSVSAWSINDSGTVAGWVTQTATDESTAFTWQSGKTTFLQSLGGSSVAYDINSAGIVVGSSDDTTGLEHAVEWNSGKVTLIGAEPGYQNSVAVAINNTGEIVGDCTSAAGSAAAFLYDDGKLSSLNSFFPASDGYNFLRALALNDSGQIISEATHDGQFEYVVLTPDTSDDPNVEIVAEIAPVPEPTISIVAGSVALMTLRRRRGLGLGSRV